MSVISSWKSHTQEDRDYAIVYMWGAIWCAIFFAITPVSVDNIFSRLVVILWTLAGLVGAVIATFGLWQKDNLLLERLGVTFLMLAPVAYSITQFGVWLFEILTTGESQRFHLIIMGLWPFFFLRKRRHHLSARVREAKATPLPGETA